MLFYVWEDTRVQAHWNHSFGMQLSFLGPVSCVSTSWVSSGLSVGSGCSLMAARGQIVLPFWDFSGLTSSPLWRLQLLTTVTSLFTDMTGNIPFLTVHIQARPSHNLSDFLILIHGRITWEVLPSPTPKVLVRIFFLMLLLKKKKKSWKTKALYKCKKNLLKWLSSYPLSFLHVTQLQVGWLIC